MRSCDMNHLRALTLQSSPETIWHIIVERKHFSLGFYYINFYIYIDIYIVKYSYIYSKMLTNKKYYKYKYK